MGKNKGHGSTKTHGGARSASIGKGQGRASDSGDSIQGETLRMIQELGIPEAAAAAMEQIESSLSPAVASSGKRQKPKKNKKNKEASATEGASRNVPPKHVNGTAPERNPVQGGDRSGDVKNVSSAAATAPGRGGQGRGRDRGQDRGAAHASNERSSLRPSEDSDVRGRSQSGRGRDSSSPRRGGGRGEVRGRGQGVGRGGGGSGGGGWGTGRGREEESDLGPFAEIKLKLKHPVAESEGNWYDDVPTSIKMGGKRAKKAGGKGVSHNDNPFSPQMVAQARAAGKALHDAEVAAWAERRSKHATSDDKWVEQVLRSGTLSDKVAALTLQVQESPVHRIRVLDGLLDLGLKKERRTAQMALEALKDLFITNLLPDGRRLVPMDSRPLSQVFDVVREASSGGGDRGSGTSGGAGKAKAAGTALIMWYFEEQIRARFYRMLEAIEAGSRDTVENFKRFSLEAAKDLLEAKPEGEDRLLCLLVNKLGDPERKITSKVIYLLQTVLSKHPAMKGVMVREVQQYLHRPGLQPKAVYAGIIFLNQVYLKKDEDAKLASSLVQTYLRLFEAASSSSSLRDGGNVPKKKSAAGDGGKNASAFETPGTRLLSALLTGVNRARPYLPPGDPSVEGSVGSLFRVVHTEGFATATQALSLLFQIVTDSPDRQLQRPTDVAKRTAGGIKRPPKNALSGGETGKKATGDEAEGAEKIRARFYSALYAKLLSPDFGGASNPVLFLNLVYKAIKADGYGPRAAAFSKRLLQVCSVCDAPLAAAGLFVVSEALKKHPDLRRALFEGAKGNRDNASNGTTGDKGLDIPGYDSSKRDPRFSFSGDTHSLQPLWEASLLRSHVHPSVSKFAEGLVSLPKHAVDYRGDPLADFALMPFLDRMAYRNPKARDPKQGDVRGMRRVKPAGVLGSDAPVNDESFVALPEGAVSADKVFFHKFFREKAERDRARGVVSKKKNASKSVEKDGRRRRRRRDGDGDGDDPTSEFMVDNVVDEKGGIGDMNFEGEEDSEEEAFAMQLAEGLMKDSGTADIDMDDEDPDMGGWSDMEDSDEDDVKGISSGKGAEVDLAPRSGGVIRGGDADDFMEEEEDSDSEPEDFEGDGSEGDSEAEEVQDMVALRKIADGMMNREGGEDEDSEGEADEVVGAKESGPSSSSNSRRVSWLRRGKMAPLYYEGEDDDDEEEDNDAEGESDSEEGYGAGPPREGVQEDDDEKGSDIPLEGEDGDSGTESDNSVGGGNRTQKHAAQSKQDRKGRPGDGETAFASFEDYEQILDAWDPENPDAPLPTEIVSALKQSQNQNQKASSFSKRGSGTGRGARGGSSGKRQKRR